MRQGEIVTNVTFCFFPTKTTTQHRNQLTRLAMEAWWRVDSETTEEGIESLYGVADVRNGTTLIVSTVRITGSGGVFARVGDGICNINVFLVVALFVVVISMSWREAVHTRTGEDASSIRPYQRVLRRVRPE